MISEEIGSYLSLWCNKNIKREVIISQLTLTRGAARASEERGALGPSTTINEMRMSHVCEKFKARKRRKVARTPDWKGEECNL
jgi:hypothetical protein